MASKIPQIMKLWKQLDAASNKGGVIIKIIMENRNIYDELKKNAYKNNTLFQVEFDITNSCNANCFFCFQGSEHINKKEVLVYNEICETLENLRNMGCYYIGFSGGEPFCRDDAIQIIEYAKKLGFFVSIVTNLQIIKQSQIESLADLGVNRINVSFHAVDSKKYCDIFKVDQELYENALKNVIYLIKRNCSVGIVSTISNKNYKDMNEIKNFFKNIGLSDKDINFNMLIQGRNDIINNRNTDELKSYLQNNKSLFNHILEKNNNSFLCSAGRITCTINPYGDIYPCSFFNSIAGNLKESSLLDIWKNSHLFKLLRSIKQNDFVKCNNCNNNIYCHICMANNMNESSLFNVPSEKYCDFRKSITNALLGGSNEN